MAKPKPVRKDPSAGAPVFVVDDNLALAEFAAVTLQAAGFTVRPFSDPKAVLAAFTESDVRPAVLVTDYDMGELNGLDLIVSLRKIHPGLKTVLLSGTVDAKVVLNHPAQVHRFLPKPYKGMQLRKVVEELLRT